MLFVGVFSLKFSLYRFKTPFIKPSMRAALSCFIRSVKWPYLSSVNAAEACPRLPCTVLISSPGPDSIHGIGVPEVVKADAVQFGSDQYL